MIYHCRVIEHVKDGAKVAFCSSKNVIPIDLMRILTHEPIGPSNPIRRGEVYDMLIKFDKYLYLMQVKDILYDKMLVDKVPGYKDGYFVWFEWVYKKGNKICQTVKFSADRTQKEKTYSHCIREYNHTPNDIKNTKLHLYPEYEYMLVMTKKEFDKYRVSRNTLGINCVVLNGIESRMKDLFSLDYCFKRNTPAYLTKLKFITKTIYLEELEKYLLKKSPIYRFVKKILDRGGLKENEFVHLGYMERINDEGY